MKGRVLIVLLPLMVLLMYPIVKPLQASSPLQDNITRFNSVLESDDIIFRVSQDYHSMFIEESGNVILDLDCIMGGSKGKAFNVNARFVVGSVDNPVFTITNNSDQNIMITVECLDNPGTIVVKSTGSSTIAPGETSDYFIEVNTQNAILGQIAAKLQIR